MIRRFFLTTKPAVLVFFVHVVKTFIFCCTETVLHSIETFRLELASALGDNIISRNHVFHGFDREKNSTSAPSSFSVSRTPIKDAFTFRIKSFCKIFFRNTKFHPLTSPVSSLENCRSSLFMDVLSFVSCPAMISKSCTVRYVFSYRTDLIQGKMLSYKTVTGYCSIGWFNSGYTTVGTWLTDRSACI